MIGATAPEELINLLKDVNFFLKKNSLQELEKLTFTEFFKNV